MSDYHFKPPKQLERFFSFIRKARVEFYKRRKIQQERTKKERVYFVKFSLIVEDPINPSQIRKTFEMYVPAKAAFFAKRKAKKALLSKIDLDFSECQHVNDDEYEKVEKSRERYLAKTNKEFARKEEES